jgi:hypothetical protein
MRRSTGDRLAVGLSRLDGPGSRCQLRIGPGLLGAVQEGRPITAASFGVIAGCGTAAAARPPWPGQGQVFAGKAAADGSWFAWRVCGANHRELGRGVMVHPRLESALSAIEHLRTHLDLAVLSYLITPSGGQWTWRLAIDAEPVATSSRAYYRQREAAYAAAAFTAAVPVAVVPTVATRRHVPAQMNSRGTPNGEVAYGPSPRHETPVAAPSVGVSQPPS